MLVCFPMVTYSCDKVFLTGLCTLVQVSNLLNAHGGCICNLTFVEHAKKKKKTSNSGFLLTCAVNYTNLINCYVGFIIEPVSVCRRIHPVVQVGVVSYLQLLPFLLLVWVL